MLFKSFKINWALMVMIFIFLPFSVEAAPIYGAEKLSELGGSLCVGIGCEKEPVIQLAAVASGDSGPVDSGTKGGGGSNKAVVTVSPDGKPMRNQPSETNAGRAQEPKITTAEIDAKDIHPSI